MTTPLDLTRLLPLRYRDKTIDSLVKNLYTRHLTKQDTIPVFGYVGDNSNLSAGDVSIQEQDLERQINQLTPLIYSEHATEKQIFSWPDLVQKLVLLGVDYAEIGRIFTSPSYNFAPPIDLDKFCNFSEYFWVGNWILDQPSLPWRELGIAKPAEITAVQALANNPTFAPSYYVIERGTLDVNGDMVSIAPNIATWSDWSICNLWVHREDLINFLVIHGGVLSFDDLTQAKLPIIEYSKLISLNTCQNSLSEPAETGTYFLTRKRRIDQVPLFNLYDHTGAHLNTTSAIFYYSEGPEFPIKDEMNRRLAVDDSGQYMFEHSQVDPDTGVMRFYKLLGSTDTLSTIWRKGPDVGSNFIKFDVAGPLINQDKFVNFKNYFWTGADSTTAPSYNATGLPEYNVIESSGTSGWALDNKWTHVSSLKKNQLKKYIQAERPIIEFNAGLESELITAKTTYAQLPRFVHYRFDDVTDTYVAIPSGSTADDTALNDAYAQQHLLVHLSDLPEVVGSVTNTPEILNNTFTFEGEIYLQGLYTGKFIAARDGFTYGYRAAGTLKPIDPDKGGLVINTVASSCTPENLVFTWTGAFFTVRGTVSGAHSNLLLNTPYTMSGINLTIALGTVPFEINDTFVVEIKSYVYVQEPLYVKIDNAFRTFATPEKAYTEQTDRIIVDGDITIGDGTWQVPPQLEWNVQSETRSVVKQGDLYYHFTRIIKAQPGLVGSEAGKNNWRNLSSRDLGLGGTIKQYDGDVALLVSILLQEGITPLALIDFARESYEGVERTVRSFVEQIVPNKLASGELSVENLPALYSAFKSYLGAASTVTADSASVEDDHLAAPFFDTTSSIYNHIVTLPYLGLASLVQPREEFDADLGFNVVVHHDGHRRRSPSVSVDILKKLVTKEFERSPGQMSAGSISGSAIPARPYKRQFWFKTTTTELFYYNVLSDTGARPSTAVVGDYTYDRQANKLYQYNGVWNQLPNTQLDSPWKILDLGSVEVQLLLALETELYQNCPTVPARLNTSALEANANFDIYMQGELEAFGVTYGVTDVYSPSFDSYNSLTWNYSTAVGGIGYTGSIATWNRIYATVYGTARPDLQPWIPAGFASEAAFLANLISASLIPNTTTKWDVSLWPATFVHIKTLYLANGVTDHLSIDTPTGELIGPYGFGSPEQLIADVPTSASSPFAFGEEGPVEFFWKQSLNYLYSKQKAYFKINPRSYLGATWGVKQLSVDGYILNPFLRQKDKPSTSQFHGDKLSETISVNWIAVTSLSPPTTPEIYTVTCVDRINTIFKVTTNVAPTPVFFTGLVFNDGRIAITLEPTLREFFYGDSFEIMLAPNGTYGLVVNPALYMRLEGLNQFYVQYNRVYGQDLSVTINKSLFTNWVTKLGYRFSGLVNTDDLYFKNGDVIDESAFNVYLKENKFFNSAWIDSLRVQLVQRGSTMRDGAYTVPAVGAVSPGEDWIFRVDNFNPRRTKLTWNALDLSATPKEFVALDGSRTLFHWKRYPSNGSTLTYSAPFLITGIQNFLNFIFGYEDYLLGAGWRFDQPESTRDESTGRYLDYQLLAEKFLVAMYSGIEAGAAITFNPFTRKVFYATPRGTVSNLNTPLGVEQETVCTVLDSKGKKIQTSNLRVFRQDEITEIVSDVQLYTLHLLTSEYEHVVLFENYSVDSLLIYDQFLGQRAFTMFITGQKQSSFTGRIDFGGHFLLNEQMKRNIESSVENILKLYDTNSSQNSVPETDRARALLGFQKKDYFEDRGSPDLTEFRFWQGMIASKGTNFAVNAYTNSNNFTSTKLDEYWAYKIADYGDARTKNKPEIKVEPSDSMTEITNYLFVEDDDLSTIRSQLNTNGYDIPYYDLNVYDGALAFNPNTFYEYTFDATGTLLIKPNDESRWFRYVDLKSFQYFEAQPIVKYNLVATSLTDLYQITDANGQPVRADVFELYNTYGGYDDDPYDEAPYDTVLFAESSDIIWRETGDLIPSSSPVAYTAAKFERVNHSTIRILDSTLLNRTLTVIGYGPAFSKYSPIELYNYSSNTTVKDDVIWWDPARGKHHPLAIATVDYSSPVNPARYNVSAINTANMNLEKFKPWGENEVGKVWWNKTGLVYKPYSDTKVVTDMHDRLAQWGSISDASSVEVYEWVKNSNPPTAYDGDGEVAINKLVQRVRTWYQRPVAWRYSDNPGLINRTYAAEHPTAIKFTISNGRGTAVLKTMSFKDLGLGKGYKISGAVYESPSKDPNELHSIFGLAKIISDKPSYTIGSTAGYDDGATWVASANFTFDLLVVDETFSFRPNNLGQYLLSKETDANNVIQIKLTHVDTGFNQAVIVRDTPVLAGSQDIYYFDRMGVKLIVNNVFGHSGWSGVTTVDQRKTALSVAVGAAHQIYVRSKVDIFAPIAFSRTITTVTPDSSDPNNLISTETVLSYTELNPTSTSNLGWIAWKDPESNPNRDTAPPYNKWVPFAGAYTPIDAYLQDLIDDIKLRTTDKWIWFDDISYVPYRFAWSTWKEVVPEIRKMIYNDLSSISDDQNFQNNFSFPDLLESKLRARVQVYVNETIMPTSRWRVGTNTADVNYISVSSLEPGDVVKVYLNPEKVSAEALAFDPAIADDPIKLNQYKRDTPHVKEVRRDETSQLSVTNYYYWVKDKSTPAKDKKMSVKKAKQLLEHHDDLYSVPQVIKFYNQVDGRPNRYALLSLKRLGQYVRAKNSYKLRLNKNPALRDDDRQLNLKNLHEEWQLLRPFQPGRIPRKLWDLLTDSMAGENQLNQAIPSSALELYDSRNKTEQRYGFSNSQIFADPKVACDTVKYTILNTRVDKYVNGTLAPDYISYVGFDINQLDTYLSTPDSIRALMSDLWRFAEPKQINEIFFAVLEDAVSKNLELTDFFKTSFISVSEIRSLGQA